MLKNSSIRSFFRPVPKDTKTSTNSHGSSSPQQLSDASPPSSSSIPDLPSSPAATSSKKPRRGVNSVVPGSDDEDADPGSSDDDLPDLFAKPSKLDQDALVTPKAKRTALAFHSSPLAAMPKHTFDMQALLDHAKSHDATELHAQRMSDMLSADRTAAADSQTADPPLTLYETMLGVFSDAEDEDEEAGRHKLLRAVRRTEASVHRKRWCFLNPAVDTAAIPHRSPFPKAAAAGEWAFLDDPERRLHAFHDGLAYTVQSKTQSLPDDVFLWILDEIVLERSDSLRQEYVRLLSVCPEQTRRLFTKERMQNLFLGLGASQDAVGSSSKITGALESDIPYTDRDWSPLRSVLTLLGKIAGSLNLESNTWAVTILLRLAVDDLIINDVDARKEFSDAMERLILTVSVDSWDHFCEEVCRYFSMAVREATLWWHALYALPVGKTRVVELRRRLAVVYIFDDPRKGVRHPDEVISVRDMLEQLECDERFIVRRDTDFYELAALASILTVAIADGGSPPEESEAARRFDEDVDRLGRYVKGIWSAIDTGGAAYMSRLEARTSWQNLQHQLPFVVRTRPPPKSRILDLPDREAEDPFQSRQRKFMEKFLKKSSLGSKD
ncbi:hypothetical protein VTK73DRAFT_2476 [Phialemonium thermophilum]|uniref:Formin GTPase-binding domain-containing protein n=1 Tax=Phialemonium thermophilum TaxID=223376 RepID=A0ABR3Y2E4_9PEZI